MKRNLVVLSLAIMFGLMVSFAFSGGTVAMRVEVPFDFYLGNQQFPAGHYRFDMGDGYHATASVVNVWAPKGAENSVLLTIPGTEKDAAVNALVFNKYGSKLFLSTISVNGHKATLKMNRLESELRSQTSQRPSRITVAQK